MVKIGYFNLLMIKQWSTCTLVPIGDAIYKLIQQIATKIPQGIQGHGHILSNTPDTKHLPFNCTQLLPMLLYELQE
jgi:hypothetical protein